MADGLVATCVQEDRRGAVTDISRRDGDAGCTREAMLAEAERLFPTQARAYANIYPPAVLRRLWQRLMMAPP